MNNKLSKKASTKIIEVVQNIDPSRSKLTTYDQAWEVISGAWGLTGDLNTYVKAGSEKTVFTLCTESERKLHTFEWNNSDVFEDGDWNWTQIFGDVLKYIIKNKLNNSKNIDKLAKKYVDEAAAACLAKVAKKRAKNELKSQKNPNQYKQSDQTKNSVKSQENIVKSGSNTTLEDLKKQIPKLYHKIYNWKLKNKDTTELEREYNTLKERVKGFCIA